jgi:rubredoxin
MTVNIEKIQGGLRVDGLELRKGRCGCTSIANCCYSWSKVKHKDSRIEMTAKTSSPQTKDLYYWAYTVEKDGITVTVSVEDARDKEFFSGYVPPPVSAWEEKGWKVVDRTGDREDGVIWRCAMCKWLYKEDEQPLPFEELPADWRCPVCNATKAEFELVS